MAISPLMLAVVAGAGVDDVDQAVMETRASIQCLRIALRPK